MKTVIAATLIALSTASIADKEGQEFYEGKNSAETASRFIKNAGEYLKHNLMANQQAAKPATLSQAGSFSTHERANAHAAWLKLNNNGADTQTESASINGAIRYRVFIDASCGSFKNQPGCGCMEVAR